MCSIKWAYFSVPVCTSPASAGSIPSPGACVTYVHVHVHMLAGVLKARVMKYEVLSWRIE